MGKQTVVRVFSCLRTIRSGYGLCQHFTAPGHNTAPSVLGHQNLLPGVVAVVDHDFFILPGIYADIGHHSKKQKDETVRYQQNFPVFSMFLFPFRISVQPQEGVVCFPPPFFPGRFLLLTFLPLHCCRL